MPSLSLVAVINTWGVVHHYRFEATEPKNGETTHRTETLEITDIGTARIRRLPWYAMNAMSRRNRSA